MIRSTFKKELKEFGRDGRVRIAFISVILLLIVSVWITSKHYQNTNQQYEIAKNNEREIWDNQGAKNLYNRCGFSAGDQYHLMSCRL